MGRAVKSRASRLLNSSGLTPAQEAFAAALAVGKSLSDAYREAHPKSCAWKPQTVHKRASEAANGEVLGRVRELMAMAVSANEVKVADVLRRYMDIAYADPNELVSVIRHCCRYCHGKGHKYQWTPAQFEAAKRRADEDTKTREPDPAGGTGYDMRLDPHPDCPECHGMGEATIVMHDTRKLSRQARALYAGAKETKLGTEVIMHSQMDAWQAIARHVGFFEKDREVQQVGGLDVAALEAKFGATMERVHARHAEMLREREDFAKGS